VLLTGQRVAVVGDWDTNLVPTGRVAVRLKPSRTWGYGWHPPTRVCLEAVERHTVPGARVLDIGTGSGLLAIAAAKLGAAEVWATDIHPDSLRIAKEHAALNGVAVNVGEELAGDDLDVIVANIGKPEFFEECLGGLVQRMVVGGILIAIIATSAGASLEADGILMGLTREAAFDVDGELVCLELRRVR
jgi:ribosomal protein L11 methyltransferase